MTYQPSLTLLFRLSVEMPRWMAAEIACLSEEQAAQLLVEAYELFFSSQVKLPLTPKKTPQEITLEALGLWFKTHQVQKPQLPNLRKREPVRPVSTLRVKGQR